MNIARRLLLCTYVTLLFGVECPPSSGQETPATPDAGAALYAYVGTFSSPLADVLPTQVDLPPGNGKGIHIFRVDRATGVWTESGVFALGSSPSHLAINADGTRLYSANETDRVDASMGQQKQGTVSAFSIDRRTGQLSMLGTVPSGGAGPTYLSIHPGGKHLLVANYFGGSVAVLPIQEDGRLEPPSDVRSPAGVIGPEQATHAPPGSYAISGHDRTHAHMIQSDPGGKHVLHVDLGLDKIFVWKFDVELGKLTAAASPIFGPPRIRLRCHCVDCSSTGNDRMDRIRSYADNCPASKLRLSRSAYHRRQCQIPPRCHANGYLRTSIVHRRKPKSPNKSCCRQTPLATLKSFA